MLLDNGLLDISAWIRHESVFGHRGVTQRQIILSAKFGPWWVSWYRVSRTSLGLRAFENFKSRRQAIRDVFFMDEVDRRGNERRSHDALSAIKSSRDQGDACGCL